MRTQQLRLAGIVISFAAACSSATPEAKPVETAEAAPTHKSKSSGMGIQSEIGGLNQDEVKRVFKQAENQLTHCWRDGMARIPYLSGMVSFHVRVGSDGHPTAVYLSESTLGEFETEKCMLEVIQSSKFPQPVGGKEGLADYSGVEFPASEDIRQPVVWSESDAGRGVKDARAALASCKAQGGGGSLGATIYVDTSGKVQSVGFAGDASTGAADCAAGKLKKLKFNSPGSYAAKISLGSE